MWHSGLIWGPRIWGFYQNPAYRELLVMCVHGRIKCWLCYLCHFCSAGCWHYCHVQIWPGGTEHIWHTCVNSLRKDEKVENQTEADQWDSLCKSRENSFNWNESQEKGGGVVMVISMWCDFSRLRNIGRNSRWLKKLHQDILLIITF